jgi:hypothetical protein
MDGFCWPLGRSEGSAPQSLSLFQLKTAGKKLLFCPSIGIAFIDLQAKFV